MSRLLALGDLDQAFQQASAHRPGNWSSLLSQQLGLAPQIEILKPQPAFLATDSTVEIEARVRTRAGQQLVPPKAFVNGIVGSNLQLARTETQGEFVDAFYHWDVRLPSDEELLVQVIASTNEEVAAEASTRFFQQPQDSPQRPQLIALAAGVNRYRDRQIPQLTYAVDNAKSVCKVLEEQAVSIYSTTTMSLSDNNVSRRTWDLTVDNLAQQLSRRVTPDDLLVLFLSGHGIRDAESDEYYFIAADAAYRDVQASRYEDCLSLRDLARFAEIPCRKLVVLDTCHSGAVQPMRQRELKYALRALQDDLFFTLTATEGGQEAVESKKRRLGRFTFRLVEGMNGAADLMTGNGDGTVAFKELFDYVRLMVPSDAESNRAIQFPTAGPRELLDLVDLPLTQPGKRTTATLPNTRLTN